MNRSNAFYKIVSVLIAIGLWSYVVVTTEPTKTELMKDVPVHLINMENLASRNLAVSGDTNFTVNVKVKGRRATIIKIKSEDILANADLFGFTPGKNYIPVSVTVPDGLTLVEVTPAKIIVNIEELVAESKPVVVGFSGKFKEGTEAGGVSTKPEAIEVSGPKSLVNQVAYIKVTVDAAKIKNGSGEIHAVAEPVNADGDPVANVTLSSKTVDVSAELFKIKEVELKVPIVGEVSSAYEVIDMIYPKKISIRGKEDIIDEIESIDAQPIDITSITTNSTLPVKPLLPGNVEVANASRKSLNLTITLNGITSRVFEYSAYEISFDDVPENLSVAVTTPKIQIKVSGKEADVKLLSKSDFEPYISLLGATKEMSIADVKVRHQKQVTTLNVVPNQISITLSEVE